MEGDWRCFITADGEQCVMMDGTQILPWLPVSSLASTASLLRKHSPLVLLGQAPQIRYIYVYVSTNDCISCQISGEYHV